MSGYNGNVNLNEQAVGFLSKALVDRGLMLSQTILNVIVMVISKCPNKHQLTL